MLVDKIDPARGGKIINAYTLGFFGKYLRGEDSPLLNGNSDDYPEVTFEKGD